MSSEEYFQTSSKVTQIKRLEFLERDVRDHAKSLTSMADSINDTNRRLAVLEQAHQQYEIYRAREEERDKALQERLKSMEAQLKSILGVGSKLLWIVGTSVVGAFIAFLLKGGLFQ